MNNQQEENYKTKWYSFVERLDGFSLFGIICFCSAIKYIFF